MAKIEFNLHGPLGRFMIYETRGHDHLFVCVSPYVCLALADAFGDPFKPQHFKRVEHVARPRDMFEPVDGGVSRVCRGASPVDNDASYFTVVSAGTLEDCSDVRAESCCFFLALHGLLACQRPLHSSWQGRRQRCPCATLCGSTLLQVHAAVLSGPVIIRYLRSIGMTAGGFHFGCSAMIVLVLH